MTVLHVASQSNSVAPLYFFKRLGVSIDAKDDNGMTALHWAAYSCAEISVDYLLAWSANLNLTDNLGQTALHTAVRRVDEAESVRSIKFLLLKGAKTHVKDKDGRTALDYCGMIENTKLRSEAITMLQKPKMWDCLVLS